MKLDEIVALAKAGFKVSDIKELLALDTEKNPPETEPAEGQAPESDPEKEPEKQPEAEPDVDYKALYEKAMSDLKIAQNNNNHQNVSGNDETFDLEKTISEALG